MNEEESIASRSQALTWEQLTYYRQPGWFIWAPYLCDLVLPLPHPHLPPPNKQVSASNSTDFLMLLIQELASLFAYWILPS